MGVIIRRKVRLVYVNDNKVALFPLLKHPCFKAQCLAPFIVAIFKASSAEISVGFLFTPF